MSSIISVIIPAYNHEKFVQETIKSIIEQTYKNIELLIIDDGSSDDTWKKIIELKPVCEKRFTNIIFEKQKNQGSSKTLNKLLSFAKGNYIFIIASDDVAKPNTIEVLYSFLSKHSEYSLAVGDNEIIDCTSKRVFWDESRNNIFEASSAKYKTFAEFLQGERKDFNFNSDSFGNYPSIVEMNYVPNGYLIRKSILDIIGGFSPSELLEDHYLMMQIAKYSKMKFINEILLSYRWHSNNSIKKQENIADKIKKTIEYEKDIINKTDWKTFSLAIQKYLKSGKKYYQFGFPFLFEFYKTKNLFFKKTYIRFMGIKIKVNQKN